MKNIEIKNSPDLWREHFPVPKREGNKYDRGYVVVGGGGIASTGAAKIVARCALRAGAGLVSVACDRESLPAYAASFQAVMTKVVENAEEFSTLIADERVTALSLGSGAGVCEKTKEFVLAALTKRKAVVLDADALSVFTANPTQLFSNIKSPCILTPHEGEFQRLFSDDGDRIAKAQNAAQLSGAVVVLKGYNTVIAAPDGIALPIYSQTSSAVGSCTKSYTSPSLPSLEIKQKHYRVVVNDNATPYLATAGSGDALAGICAGLLAQGMPAFEAACAAVWLHAEVGTKFGAGLIAEDIAEMLPDTLSGIIS